LTQRVQRTMRAGGKNPQDREHIREKSSKSGKKGGMPVNTAQITTMGGPTGRRRVNQRKATIMKAKIKKTEGKKHQSRSPR